MSSCNLRRFWGKISRKRAAFCAVKFDKHGKKPTGLAKTMELAKKGTNSSKAGVPYMQRTCQEGLSLDRHFRHDIIMLISTEFDREVTIVENRIVDDEIMLVKYYPNYRTTLVWYQDLDLCKQVDNRDAVYDLDLLKCMYKYLDRHGDLFYIKYRNRLCGDVCLQPSGEVNIVIAKPFQNKHIGRRVIKEIVRLAKEKQIPELYAQIYCFNTQSQKMFQSIGFRRMSDEQYVLIV